MKTKLICVLTLTLLSSLTGFAQRSNSGAPVAVGSELADVTAYHEDGSEYPLKEKFKGKHAVIVFGCLTWPPFLRNISGLEAIYNDYKEKDVEFFYIYKALAHPERDGLVQPISLEERLKHIALAKKKYDTKMPWLVDSMDNDLKHAFGDRPNSEFIISPEGKITISRSWSTPSELRSDLEKLVGKSDSVTQPKYASPKSSPAKYPTGIVPRVPRPSGATALVVKAAESKHPHYVKARVEAEHAVTNGSGGKLHIGFHIDPIHEVHWNNLAAPLKWSIETPEGITLSTTSGEATAVEEKADVDPREFLVDLKGSSEEPLKLTVQYFACDDNDKWCKAVTQEYAIKLVADKDGGRVSSRGGKGGKGGGKGGKGGMRDVGSMIEMMDANGDGKIAKSEARGRMADNFSRVDTDGDGFVSKDELKVRMAQRRR